MIDNKNTGVPGIMSPQINVFMKNPDKRQPDIAPDTAHSVNDIATSYLTKKRRNQYYGSYNYQEGNKQDKSIDGVYYLKKF